MFSYGSSARAGVVRRSHGGRPYRPPPERREPNAKTPPPLKECTCLIEIDAPEYQMTEPLGRQHLCFGGREQMEQCQRTLRSSYHVHLMVPGKKQMGPLSIISKSAHEAIPALAWLLENWDAGEIEGRIYRNVSEGRDSVLRGVFPCRTQGRSLDGDFPSSSLSQPFWLFQSPQWAVLAYPLNSESNDPPETENNTDPVDRVSGGFFVSAMRTCLDNIVFQLGQEAGGQLSTFVDCAQNYAFVVGDPRQANVLRKEIAKFVRTT